MRPHRAADPRSRSLTVAEQQVDEVTCRRRDDEVEALVAVHVADAHVSRSEVESHGSAHRLEMRLPVTEVRPDETGLLMPRQEIEVAVAVDVGEQHLPGCAPDVERRHFGGLEQRCGLSAALAAAYQREEDDQRRDTLHLASTTPPERGVQRNEKRLRHALLRSVPE